MSEDAGEFLERLGMDAVKWSAEFEQQNQTGLPQDQLVAWFSNAIMAGYDRGLADCGRRDAMSFPYPESAP